MKNWEYRVSELLERRGYEVVRVPYPNFPKPYWRVDLVFASHHMAAPLAMHLAEREGCPFVAQILDVPKFRFEEPWSSNLRKYLRISLEQYKAEWTEIGEALREADLVMAISKATAQDVKDWFGVDAKVNYLGVDWEVAESALAGSDPTQKREQFCFLSLLYDHKRPDLLVELFAKRNERLVMMGDGYLMPILREKATRNVVLTGAVSEQQKFRVLARSLALIHPSVHEGFSIPICESLYARTPVLAYDLPIYHEIFGNKLYYWRSLNELTELMDEVKESKPEGSRDFILRRRLTLQDYADRLSRLFEVVS